jgi:hypothetical protein
MLRVNLLLNPANRSWIIQKIAENLADHLSEFDVDARITEKPDKTTQLVHHMSWAFANMRLPQPSTMFITHLDDIYKVKQVQQTLRSDVNVGICMSSDAMHRLVEQGVPSTSLYYISPAHDGLIQPRKIVIGITSRLYSDGRKRESLLTELAERIPLDPFEFRIFGLGWDQIVKDLERAGAKVTYFGESDDFRKDYSLMQSEIPKFDYYLYLGMDEGSLGTLDALSAGVATIVTPQGFHLDIPGGITHPVVSIDDLERVFNSISDQRFLKIQSVVNLSWLNYASNHAAVWKAIIGHKPLPPLATIDIASIKDMKTSMDIRDKQLYTNALYPRRIVSAVSHLSIMKYLRRFIDKSRIKK